MAIDTITVLYEVEAGDSVKELKTLERQLEKTEGVFIESQTNIRKASKARQQLLKEEQQDLKQLRANSKAAFTTRDVEQYNKRIRESQKNVKTLETSLGKSTKVTKFFNSELLKLAGTIGAAFAVERIIAFGKELLKNAVQLEAFRKRAETVFGDAVKFVREFAEQNAQSLGFSNTQFEGAAAAIGDLLVPLGFARDIAAEMSVEALKVGAALKEFTGDSRSAAEISQVVAKAFTGEVEGLKALGITVNRTTDEFRNFVKIKIRDEGATQLQAQALAIFETVQNSATDALMSFQENADSLSRVQSQLAANTATLTDNLADNLAPVFEIVLTLLVRLTGGFNDVNEELEEFNDLIPLTASEAEVLADNIADVAAAQDIVIAGLKVGQTVTFESALAQAKLNRELEEAEKLAEDGEKTAVKRLNTIRLLQGELKRLNELRLDAVLGSGELARIELDIIDIENRLAIATGKTNDEFEKRLKLIRERGREAVDIAREEEESAKDAAAAAVSQLEEELGLLRQVDELNKGFAEDSQKQRELDELEDTKRNEAFFQGILDRRAANKEFAEELIAQSDLVTGIIITNQRLTLESDIASQKRQLDNRLITEEEFAENVKNLQREQAQREKALAVFESGIKLALAVLSALVKDPTGILAARVAFLGSVEVLAIQATPIPQFKEGGLAVGQGVTDDGGFPAILHNKEYVVPSKPTAQFRRELDAMRDGTYRDLVDNQLSDYVASELKALNISVTGSSGNSNEIHGNRVATGIKGGTKQSIANTDRIVNAMKASDMDRYRYDKRF